MRFEEDVHWTDGLFLQPHHLQRMQYALHSRLRAERAALTPFPYGLVDFEIDDDALANGRVVVKRLSALMPGGEEISMPGNAVIPPLDISEELENHRECILVSLALPLWSELDANLADGGDVRAKRLFLVRTDLEVVFHAARVANVESLDSIALADASTSHSTRFPTRSGSALRAPTLGAPCS